MGDSSASRIGNSLNIEKEKGIADLAADFDPIKTYLEAEPGAIIDLDAELLQSKEEREDEDAARASQYASFRACLQDLCSSKTIAWKRWRLAVFTEGNQFKLVFISLVCINGVLIGVEADHGTTDIQLAWQIVEAIFLTFFGIELVTKMMAFGFLFFASGWNVFDLTIVSISVAELIMSMGMGQSNSGLSAFRLLRIFRVIRVVAFVQRLNLLVQAFISAMSSVLWVGILLLMAVYMFAIVSQTLFKDVMPERFGTVLRSMATLFQTLSGDGWASGIVWPIAEQDNYMYAWAFFLLFFLIAGFGLLNLLMGVFIEALMTITKKNDIDAKNAMEKQRRHMIQLVSNAFLKTDADGGGTLDETELPEMLGLLEQWSDMLDHVGLSAEAMQRACLIADYSHEGRSHWQHTDEHGNVSHKVYHDKLRPAPSKGTRGFKRVLSTEEGVMEAEIVQTLIDMDQGTTRAEFFEIMKAFRLFNKKKTQQIEEMDHGLNQRMREAMRLCGGDSGWKPPPMPCKQVIDEDDREEPGNEEKYVAGKESKLSNGEKLSKNDDGLGKKQGMPQQGNETGAGAKPAMEALPEISMDDAIAMFERYDLDDSGTINSAMELGQLVTNMMFSLSCSTQLVEKVRGRMKELEEDEFDMDLDAFLTWFEDAVTRP